ncbi:MAG TPA: hypothetical protein VFA93_01690 [Patescibacteria group bacterium]|nr:hypothetical protein [Patescibacteria group bacterium]
MEVPEAEKSWDGRKILAFFLLIALLGFSFKALFLDKSGLDNFKRKSIGVAGVSAKQEPGNSTSNELKKGVESKLNDLRKEVNQINVVEVATSTPAVQKVLNDIKGIQNLPQSEAKNACLKICSGL